MPFQTDIKDENIDVRVLGDTAVPYDDPSLSDYIKFCTQMHEVVPLTNIVLEKLSPAAPVKYKYSIEAEDTRSWEQVFNFSSGLGSEPTMTFNVPDEWLLSEFALQRPIREHALELIRTYLPSKIEVKW